MLGKEGIYTNRDESRFCNKWKTSYKVKNEDESRDLNGRIEISRGDVLLSGVRLVSVGYCLGK